MPYKIKNYLHAIAPLSKSTLDLEDVLIISFLEHGWHQGLKIQVNTIIDGIPNLSPSTIHRRLKRFKNDSILSYKINKLNQRVRLVEKGEKYQDCLKQIESLYDCCSNLQKL